VDSRPAYADCSSRGGSRAARGPPDLRAEAELAERGVLRRRRHVRVVLAAPGLELAAHVASWSDCRRARRGPNARYCEMASRRCLPHVAASFAARGTPPWTPCARGRAEARPGEGCPHQCDELPAVDRRLVDDRLPLRPRLASVIVASEARIRRSGEEAVLDQVPRWSGCEGRTSRRSARDPASGPWSVVVHDLADDARGGEVRQAREIDRALRLPTCARAPRPCGPARGTRARASRRLTARASGLAATRIVCARSAALMPVVTPRPRLMLTVKAVTSAGTPLPAQAAASWAA